MSNKDELIRFGVSMPERLAEQFDDFIAAKGYGNRSEAIRDLVRKALLEPGAIESDQLVAGTIVMVYDHHASELSALLTELQHRYHHDIISTMHIHLNHEQCLEVLVVRGMLTRLHELHRAIQVLKGVLYAELSVTHIDMDDMHSHSHPHSHPHSHSSPRE
ncbi:nickel-responsive transcriptional regulator NikR [Paenibacillus turpanensis]|uniref:nickel-responsive transcriptional regulator NikR n=1 Tax=Paenibacillus turpanensis TaxID=2689078 RepID=UPI001A9CEB8C|nr:nickel-responsive transcriptional regulator NikR [Paenibacillus turpanensis]